MRFEQQHQIYIVPLMKSIHKHNVKKKKVNGYHTHREQDMVDLYTHNSESECFLAKQRT